MKGQARMTIFVPGASAGFGAALVRRFAAKGARVVATARRKDKLAALASELGDAVLPLALDVQDRAAVERAIATLPSAFAEIDCVVNNAGLALGLEPAARADLANWDRMIDTNCKGVVYVTRAVLPGMVARGRGHVVSSGSTPAGSPSPDANDSVSP